MHLVSSETPFRLNESTADLSFHQVQTPAYPLFREPRYLLSLANTVVQVGREFDLDIIRAHYAIPHATAALLAKQVLHATECGPVPKVVTTLHGTDIALVGNDPSSSGIVAYSIESSDAVTAVSNSLRTATQRELGVHREIAVNYRIFSIAVSSAGWTCLIFGHRLAGRTAKVVAHVSNFRPVTRVDTVMAVFARIARKVPARLLMVGDGPELGTVYRLGRELGISNLVDAKGAQDAVIPLLSAADLFLLPSRAGEFRPRRARGDGLRGPGRRVGRRRPAGSDRERPVGLPPSRGRRRGDRRQRNAAC